MPSFATRLRARLNANALRIELNRRIRRFDLGVYRVSNYEQGRESLVRGDGSLPAGAAEALTLDNPRIAELREAYAGHPAHSLSVWSDTRLRDQIDPAYFRSDTQYVYQARGTTELAYRLSYETAKQSDALGLFDVLEEDGSFGALTFDVEGTTISRDLIDSVLEINFLADVLGVEALRAANLLDIGAGYGRLAHRLLAWSTEISVTSTDAVPISTFLCEYFLHDHLGRNEADVVPLHEASSAIRAGSFDIATNIHSWPEAPSDSVRWWIEQIASARIPTIVIVHESADLFTTSHLLSHEPLNPVLQSFGYRLDLVREKYEGSELAQRLGAFPAYYFVYRR